MAPKNKKPAGPDKGKQGEEEREEPFQAVVRRALLASVHGLTD